MSSARWPVVIFDLDGTLVDTVGLIVSSFQHTWREGFGEDLDAGVARSWIGRTLPDLFAPYGPEKAEELKELFITYNVAELPRQQRTYPGVAGLLDRLHRAGVVTGIATSKRRPTAQLSLDVAGITGVRLLATLEDTPRHKPDPAPLLHALDQLGSTPEEAVYVGDAVVDIQAARAAGLASVAVSWGAGLPDALAAARPDALVDHAEELWEVLAGAHRAQAAPALG
ncbi:MAG: HAD-IA family hydrolase [Propionibacteriaceae bacterium]|nr:HAD-IA family hydrolase [Propionibacteriaceae bacterium]